MGWGHDSCHLEECGVSRTWNSGNLCPFTCPFSAARHALPALTVCRAWAIRLRFCSSRLLARVFRSSSSSSKALATCRACWVLRGGTDMRGGRQRSRAKYARRTEGAWERARGRPRGTERTGVQCGVEKVFTQEGNMRPYSKGRNGVRGGKEGKTRMRQSRLKPKARR